MADGDEEETGEPGDLTVAARVGELLDAQTMRATIDIANVLRGLGRG